MASPRDLPMCRLGYRFVLNGVRPTLWPVGAGRLPDRNALEHRLPAYDATHNYFLPASGGAFYWSPISHCPAAMDKIFW
jgi:hypothetical protein